jgi:hypothetical protein
MVVWGRSGRALEGELHRGQIDRREEGTVSSGVQLLHETLYLFALPRVEQSVGPLRSTRSGHGGERNPHALSV